MQLMFHLEEAGTGNDDGFDDGKIEMSQQGLHGAFKEAQDGLVVLRRRSLALSRNR